MWRILFKTLILCAAVFALGITGYSQTIECDGLADPGTGSFSGAAPASCGGPLDYLYRITDPHPEAPESVYIGTHDGNILHYKNVCMPAGWSFNIVPASPNVHFSFLVPHGSTFTGTDGSCPFYMEFFGPMTAGSIYIGFNHGAVAHEVSWEIGTLGANVSVVWANAVGAGAGPVHAPFACDSTGTILYGDGDCNVDGIVLTVADMSYLNAFLHGGAPLPSALYHSDLNGDCVVDSLDLILYQNYFIFGLSVFAPYGGYPVPTCCSVGVVIYPGDTLGDICGVKFEDIDCDGVKDAGEPGIPNWEIFLYQGTTPVAGSPVTTNANGGYCFFNLTPGTYRVREKSQPGWIQTFPPTNAYFNVNVVAGLITQNIDFGNTRDTCPPPSTLQFVTQEDGGRDNFVGPVASTPSPVDFAGACFNTPNHFFDANQDNSCFGHTFTGFKPNDSCCIIDAELCFRITPSGGQPETDGMWIIEDGATAWFLSMHDLISWVTGGADTSWNVGDTIDTCINLANTPPPGYMGLTHAMAALHDGDLSVMFQDDTKIDYLELRVTLCCPRQPVDSLGACCPVEGPCVDGVTAAQCAAMPGGAGTFFLGKTCAQIPPCDSLGACCPVDGPCVGGVTAAQCAAMPGGAGTFFLGQTCATIPSCDSLGACCPVDGPCVDGVTASQCATMPGGAGTFFLGQTCATIPSCDSLGACCPVDGPCVDGVTASQCATMPGGPGTFFLGQTCASIPSCDSLGVCCGPNGSCTPVHSAGECDSLWDGLGTFTLGGTCVPNTCPQPTDSCDFTVICCDNKPTVAQRQSPPNFKGQVAVFTRDTNYPPVTNGRYVVGIVDLTGQCTAPIGAPPFTPGFTPPIYFNENTVINPNPTGSADDEWRVANLGTVFGLCLDTLGNIYAAATSCYAIDVFSTVHSPLGTGGDIYKLNGATGKISPFGAFPNTGQGLGDITYDCRHDQMFVSNMEDGLIYFIGNVSGSPFLSAGGYDHGIDGRTAENLSPTIADAGTANTFTQRGRRIWALQVVNGTFAGQPFYRLFYSVWWESLDITNPSEQNEIWSVGLDLGTGLIIPTSARREIQLPPFGATNTSAPVSDISFTSDGRMILAERDMFGESSSGTSGRLLSYDCVNGLWTRELNSTPDDIFQIVQVPPPLYPGCAGGVDVDFRTYPPSVCPGRVWATGNLLRNSQNSSIDGLAGFPMSGGNSSNNLDCILIDLASDPVTGWWDFKQTGDVELPCRHCFGLRGDVNADLADANILDLTFLVDRIFRGGPAPYDLEEADVKVDGGINILDLTFMVDRIFRGGPAPLQCPQCCTD